MDVMESRPAYRADIDGIRAVAVLPVVFFHAGYTSLAGIPLASGGYVGVDIFFVISGYLISGVIYQQVNGNSYSVFSFYARRVRRIFPALFMVYLACLIWGTLRGIFSDAEGIKNATIASVLFVSNMYFSASAGYFDHNMQGNPLLHTWSLSIEEQFYIIFPIVLLLIRRFARIIKIYILAVIVFMSLAISIYLSRMAPDVAYFSLAARVWELGIGGWLSIASPRIQSRLLAESLALIGVLGITVSVVTFDHTTEFPGYSALLPTLGAAAIILSGSFHKTIISRCLSLQPIRWIGLVSYSIYLWHWPILVISRLEGFDSRKSALGAILACFAISWISWRFVEQPFRSERYRSSAKRTVVAGAMAMAATLVLSCGSTPLNSFLSPMDDEVRNYVTFDSMRSESAMRPGTCFLTSKYNNIGYYRRDMCLKLRGDISNVLLIGDSHAAQYYEALRSINADANILQATASGCLPLLDTFGSQYCVDLWNIILRDFLPGKTLDSIVVVGRWQAGMSAKALSTARYLRKFANRVVIIGPNEEFTAAMPRTLIKARIYSDNAILERTIKSEPREVDREFMTIDAQEKSIYYVSFFEAICTQKCPVTSSSGDPLIFDDNHLSLSAAIDVLGAAGDVFKFNSSIH